MDKPLAHVKECDGEWLEHCLEDHLIKVAGLAKSFVAGSDQALLEMAGRWHDLGKYQAQWQDYLKSKSGYNPDAHIEAKARVNHSTAGAIHAVKVLGDGFGHILAYLIAGHHAGLTDWDTAEAGRGSLKYRLDSSAQEYVDALAAAPSERILKQREVTLPVVDQPSKFIALWMRMLFSCLVDADFLDTESFMDEGKAAHRGAFPDLSELQSHFDREMQCLRKNSDDTPLNKVRNEIFQSCVDAARLEPGLFSLTVPTGGGKTLSSLAFALEHAKIHNKSRVIYAIPFTSIIEQNADVFRKFVGADNVLEHHSNLDPEPDKENRYSRLAADNWDAPLIVTTNVQLFESLHASRPSRCRKLHNIRDSVIVLDEAQQLPRDFHAPITQVMQQLSEHFGVTWVLCTATQPDLSQQKDAFGKTLLGGLSNIREIISNPIAMAEQLKRVEVELPTLEAPKLSWPEVAEQIQQHDCILVVVNTRRQAKELLELLPADNNSLHLSANMCAEHRTAILDQIKERLEKRRAGDQRPLRLVSTQLIEAGVDVDFPVVYRAMAGLDSIAQAAGRCNREGKLAGLGRVVVFKPQQRAPIGFLRQGEDATTELIAAGQLADPLSPKNFSTYFKLINGGGDRDKHGIVDLLTAQQSNDAPLAISFRSAAEKFRLIDNVGVAVIVPYTAVEGQKSPVHQWVAKLESDPSAKWVYKKLQRYTVTLPETFAKQLQANHCLKQRAGLFVLYDIYYNAIWGVDSPDTLLSVESCVVS
ncbi:MAG: CRISPR-associated helicase Cas3' [Pseudomonadales bacterium]